MATKGARKYEAMFLFPSASTSDVEGALQLARKTIESHGGTIIVLKKWDERKLAYEIQGNKRGLFVIAYFEGPTTSVAAIERDVRLSESILRVLITKADHLNEQEMNAVEPQPIVRVEERPMEDFGGPGMGREGRPPRRPRRDQPEGELAEKGI